MYTFLRRFDTWRCIFFSWFHTHDASRYCPLLFGHPPLDTEIYFGLSYSRSCRPAAHNDRKGCFLKLERKNNWYVFSTFWIHRHPKILTVPNYIFQPQNSKQIWICIGPLCIKKVSKIKCIPKSCASGFCKTKTKQYQKAKSSFFDTPFMLETLWPD